MKKTERVSMDVFKRRAENLHRFTRADRTLEPRGYLLNIKRRHNMGKSQWVVKTDDGWGVRGEGNERLTSRHNTQAQAIEAGRRIARNEKTELIIQGCDGKIIDRDSYGHDPRSSKDTKH